jgi:singapore isolate B (sub-type 7) whole genome shotgun sequence assembly, scaffold_1
VRKQLKPFGRLSKAKGNPILLFVMLSVSRYSPLGRRWMATAAKNVKQEKPAKTTYDTGKELENRVARMLKKRGHICIKQNQRVKDRNGNWSEFDIVYGWPVKHYVECKNYSQPVKLEMVAKFKEVLRLHRIPKSRGLFVTTSTYTPRATTIGINCIDGAGLERLERTAFTAKMTKYLIVCICGVGSYALYWYCSIGFVL